MTTYIETLIPSIKNINNINHFFFQLFNNQNDENFSSIKTYVQNLDLKPFVEQKHSLIFQTCLNHSDFLQQLLAIYKYLKIDAILNFNEKELYNECTKIGQMLYNLNLYRHVDETDPMVETLYSKAKEDLEKIKNLDQIHNDYEKNYLKEYKKYIQKGLISFLVFDSAYKMFEFQPILRNLTENGYFEKKIETFTQPVTKVDNSVFNNKNAKILIISLVAASALTMLIYYLYTMQYNAMNSPKNKIIELEME